MTEAGRLLCWSGLDRDPRLVRNTGPSDGLIAVETAPAVECR